MLKIKTFGGSHACFLGGSVKGLPKGHKINVAEIERELMRRRIGIGRSARQTIEKDCVEVLSGLTDGLTDGGEFGFRIKNADDRLKEKPPITALRPSHADLAGCKKFGLLDARMVAEIAGGRSTLPHTVIGSACRQILSRAGIFTYGFTLAVGGVGAEGAFDYAKMNEKTQNSPLVTFDANAEKAMTEKILWAREKGDTLGGLAAAGAVGLPVGLGDPRDYYAKLQSKIAAYMMAIPSVKGIEFGLGQAFAGLTGSEATEKLGLEGGGIVYMTNNSGGIIGGMSNGREIYFTLTVKPIPSVANAPDTYDIVTKKRVPAHYERSDVCVVPNIAVIAQNMLGTVLLDALLCDKKLSKQLSLR